MNKSNIIRSLLVVFSGLSLGVGSFAVQAQDVEQSAQAMHQKGHAKHFGRWDTNGDGSITADEVKGTRFEKHFAKFDSNGDGKITQDEKQAMHAKRRAEHFKKMDINGDGALTKEEAIARAQERINKRFERADTNKDGKITQEEMQSRHKMMQPKM